MVISLCFFLLNYFARQHALEEFHGVAFLFYRKSRSTLERIFHVHVFVLMFTHHMIWKDVHTLYYAILADIACDRQEMLVIVVDARGDYMANPYRFANALQILHHLVWMRAIMRCKAWVQFIVHGLYIEQNQVGHFKKTAYGIVEDNSAGIQSRMYALLLA